MCVAASGQSRAAGGGTAVASAYGFCSSSWPVVLSYCPDSLTLSAQRLTACVGEGWGGGEPMMGSARDALRGHGARWIRGSKTSMRLERLLGGLVIALQLWIEGRGAYASFYAGNVGQ